MRRVMNDVVEAGRIRTGPYASGTGDRFGAFFLRAPTGMKLTVIASEGGPGIPWEHVSVSTPTRPPLWEEMSWVKDLFWEPEEPAVQYHPAKSQYVNVHPNCLHMWRPTATELVLPPLIAV